MFRSSYKIATVMGIPIRLHISLILILLFFISKFGFVAGITVEIGLAVSIVLHELGHSAVAIRKGCRVREITLLVVGGAAQMEKVPTRPLDEFLMALTGPVVSLCLGISLLFVGDKLPLPPLHAQTFYRANLLEVLGATNIALALFNLLPAFPMDGGRILRAALTPRLGRKRATRAAARLGQILAILAGVYALTTFPRNLILLLVAAFVFFLADREARTVDREETRKQRRSTSWDRAGNLWSDPSGRDEAIIGPPPYRHEPAAHVKIRKDRENPLRRFS
jgi:Zn-dependent protease